MNSAGASFNAGQRDAATAIEQLGRAEALRLYRPVFRELLHSPDIDQNLRATAVLLASEADDLLDNIAHDIQ